MEFVCWCLVSISISTHTEQPPLTTMQSRAENLSIFSPPSNFLRDSCSVSGAAIACTYCNTGGFDIAPLEECRFSMKGSRANLASVDKRLDMMKAHRVMAVLANHRYRFCYCHPVVVHIGVSLFGQSSRFMWYTWWLMIR
jgi:hypothetical protein